MNSGEQVLVILDLCYSSGMFGGIFGNIFNLEDTWIINFSSCGPEEESEVDFFMIDGIEHAFSFYTYHLCRMLFLLGDELPNGELTNIFVHAAT